MPKLPFGSRSKVVLGLLAFFFQAACGQLEPLNLPSESAVPAEEAGPLSVVETVARQNWQIPLNTGRDALEWRLRAIDSAVGSLDLQTFLWLDDTVGNLFKERILKAADRGVKVRILIDDSFLAGQDQSSLRLGAHPNISYRVYNPYGRRSNSTVSRTVLNLGEFSRLDHRMHNKLMVADGHIAIIGGRNLADEYFGMDPQSNFRDMELLVGGPIISDLEASFDSYWNDRWAFPIEKLARLQTQNVSINEFAAKAKTASTEFPSETAAQQQSAWRNVAKESYRGRARLHVDAPPKDRPEAIADRPAQVANELERLIGDARSEVIAVSAYLIPTPTLTDVLRDAEARGVDVKLLTNSINSNNHLSAYAVYRNHIAELLNLGAEVHEVRADAKDRYRYIFAPVVEKKLGLHAKYLVVDRRKVFIGSANLDPRSLRINTEIGLLVDSPSLAKELIALTEVDFAPENAWRLENVDGSLVWSSADTRRQTSPAESGFQRLEAWFFAHLPIEAEM